MPSDVEGIGLLVRCDPAIPRSGYSAETDSGVPLDSDYARERGADRGLVVLMDGARRVRRLHIARAQIRTVVTVGYDSDVLERMDLLLMADGGLIVVHTFTTNAGIFTNSEVWQLPAPSGRSSMPPAIREHARRALDGCGLTGVAASLADGGAGARAAVSAHDRSLAGSSVPRRARAW